MAIHRLNILDCSSNTIIKYTHSQREYSLILQLMNISTFTTIHHCHILWIFS